MVLVILESDRLLMRNYKESDLDDYHRMMSDKKNMYFLTGLITNSIEESQKSLQDAIKANSSGKCRRFCITLKENDRLIGAVGYEIPYETPVGKIADPMGWFIMPVYQNKGYMTEAARRVLAFAFLQDNCVRVVTACFKENIPTQKVMKKAGFRKEAEMLSAMWHDGQMRDRLEFAINRDEYIKIYGIK
jgi:RimJ/RimL family protein N-acetyltransferase